MTTITHKKHPREVVLDKMNILAKSKKINEDQKFQEEDRTTETK